MNQNEIVLTGVFHAFPDPIFIIDKECRIIMANEAFCKLAGTAVSEVKNKRLDKLFAPGVCSAFNKPRDIELKREILIKNQQGKEIPFQVTMVNSHFGDDDLLFFILKDIGSVKEAEVSLVESESLYKTLVNQLPNPIVIHINGKVVFANDLIIEVTGLSNEEVIGKNIADLMTDPNGPSSKLDFGSLMWDSFMEEEEFEIRTEDRKLVIKRYFSINYD
jgi:PAS domain S-box-containing protein